MRSRLFRTSRIEALENRLAMAAQPLADFGLDAFYKEQTNQALEHPTTLISQAYQTDGVNSIREQYGFVGDGQTAVIIDSGIAWDHQALGGGFGKTHRVVGGWDFAEDDPHPYDDGPAGFHGTHVSGILASNDPTYPGVAPGVDLVGLRVLDDRGSGYFHWIEQAARWVHDHRNDFEHPITTVNISIGSHWNSDVIPFWATLEDEFAQLEEDGIFVAVAAGNSFGYFQTEGLSYPAASSYVIPVSAVGPTGQLASFSQRQDRALAAPGVNIKSTIPDHRGNADNIGNDWSYATGTSMASPYLAGISVLVREAMQFAGVPHVSQDDIYAVLRDTADSVWDPITSQHYQRVNVEEAIHSVMPKDDYGSDVTTAFELGDISAHKIVTGWINCLDDQDHFTFLADRTGTIEITANATRDLSLRFETTETNAQDLDNGLRLEVLEGERYHFAVTTSGGIGQFDLAFKTQPQVLHPANDSDFEFFVNVDTQRGQESVHWDRETGIWTVTNHRGRTSTDEIWGNWSPATKWHDVQVADINGDGLCDIVGRDNHEWWVAKSNGGSFDTTRWCEFSNSTSWHDVLIGDFDGDRRDDIAGRDEEGRWWVVRSTPQGPEVQQWTRWMPTASWKHVSVADVNGDGRDDIVGHAGNSFWVARSIGHRFTNKNWLRVPTAAEWQDVQIADVNGDGSADIIGRHHGALMVAQSQQTHFATQQWGRWSELVDWQHVNAADVNGDGRADLVGFAGGSWWVGQSLGHRFTNVRWSQWSGTSHWTDVCATDYDGDGRDDLVGRLNGTVTYARSNGKGFDYGKLQNVLERPSATWIPLTTQSSVPGHPLSPSRDLAHSLATATFTAHPTDHATSSQPTPSSQQRILQSENQSPDLFSSISLSEHPVCRKTSLEENLLAILGGEPRDLQAVDATFAGLDPIRL